MWDYGSTVRTTDILNYVYVGNWQMFFEYVSFDFFFLTHMLVLLLLLIVEGRIVTVCNWSPYGLNS